LVRMVHIILMLRYRKEVRRMKCECKRCGHKWESATDRRPKACPACKSYRWDKAKREAK